MPHKVKSEDKPGIYKILNKINGKVYIGQTWHLNYRWIQHKSAEHNIHLSRAFEQYGIENFEYSILEEFPPAEGTRDLLYDREIYYIAQYHATNPKYGYNIMEGGRGRPLAPETIAKLKAIRGPLHHGWKRVVGDEERRQMSERMKGPKNPMYGRSPAKEMNERYSRERQGSNNPAARKVKCIETGKVYDTIKQAADDTGIGRDPISYVCHKRKGHSQAGGFHWEFA
jgi:group I intron endonuclease